MCHARDAGLPLRALVQRRNASKLKPSANAGSAPAQRREQAYAARHRRSRQESEKPLCAEPMLNDCGDAGFRVMSAEPTARFFETRKPASPALRTGRRLSAGRRRRRMRAGLPTQKRRDLAIATFKCRGKLLKCPPYIAARRIIRRSSSGAPAARRFLAWLGW